GRCWNAIALVGDRESSLTTKWRAGAPIVTRSPSSLVSVVWKAIEWVANGGAARPKEWTMRPRLAPAPAAELALSITRRSPSDTPPQIVIGRQRDLIKDIGPPLYPH